MKKFLLIISLICYLGFSQTIKQDGVFAIISTNKGKIVLQLAYDKAPITVANFVSLAEGTNTVVDTQYKGKPYYNGLKFHRVIANFMIQGGDPTGTGSSGPGYKFTDEITDLKHNSAGILSMANAGLGTNGSQFFITHKETPWLDGKHTVFGKVIEGQEVVNAIAQNDVMESIEIIRKGKEAKKFNAAQIFANYVANKEAKDKEIAQVNNEFIQKQKKLQKEIQKKQAELQTQKQKELDAKLAPLFAEKKAYFTNQKTKSTTLPSGLQYIITKKGNGIKPAEGEAIKLNYSGYFPNGKLLDTNIQEIAEKFGKYDKNRAQMKGYEPMASSIGDKRFIPGFTEGLNYIKQGGKILLFIPSKLAWGEKGGGNIIPPNTDVIFEIEIME